MVLLDTRKETQMATSQTTKTTAAPKTKKVGPTPVQRVTDILKRAALQGRISADELEVVGTLAGSLKVFLKS
jgi:hypothetical protein